MEINLKVFNHWLADQEKMFSQGSDNKEMLEAIERTRQFAKKCCDKGDFLKIMNLLGSGHCLAFLADNIYSFKKVGVYEKELLDAYIGVKTNYSGWSPGVIELLFHHADAKKLRAAGDKVPDQDYFTLYRGVSGNGRARRVNGFSWTDSPSIAAWFATRFHLNDPAVFQVTVPNDCVLAVINERNEMEYLLKLPLPSKPKRLKEMPKPEIEKS